MDTKAFADWATSQKCTVCDRVLSKGQSFLLNVDPEKGLTVKHFRCLMEVYNIIPKLAQARKDKSSRRAP